MGGSQAAHGAAEIGRLRHQILVLADGDCVRPEDESALLAALDAALRNMAAGELPAVRAELGRFIAGAECLIEAGVLAGREGNPPLAAARALLAWLFG